MICFSNFNKRIKIFNKQIIFPYLKFGNTDVFNLLGTDELLIFLFYNKTSTSSFVVDKLHMI